MNWKTLIEKASENVNFINNINNELARQVILERSIVYIISKGEFRWNFQKLQGETVF